MRLKAHVVEALSGLAELGDASAREPLLPLIESKEKEIRQAAVRALVWTSRPGALDALRDALRHSDDTVKKEAALGLAYYGDSAGASMIFGSSGVSPDEELLAALGLIEVAEDQFFAFLDRSDARLRRRAFLLLLLLEMSEQDGIPDKCLAALSSAYADVRLDAARGLETFADRDAFKAYVREAFLETVPQRARWDIKPEVLEAMSLAVTYGGAQVRVRAARLLETLREDTSQSFDRAWEIYLRRYGAQLDALTPAGEERARLALDVYCYRIRKYIGAYAAAMGGIDAIGFTGGVGQNAAGIRARCLQGLDFLGVEVDASANAGLTGGEEGLFHAGRVALAAIRTGEELVIALEAERLATVDRAPPRD